MDTQLNSLEIDPHQPLAEMSVGDLLELLGRRNAMCVDFSNAPMGYVPVPVFAFERFKFMLSSPGQIADIEQPGQPLRRYLAFDGTGQILVEVPHLAKMIGVYVANRGGSDLDIDFRTDDGTLTCAYSKPPGPLEQFICKGKSLSYVFIKVESAECLIWRVCYVPE